MRSPPPSRTTTQTNPQPHAQQYPQPHAQQYPQQYRPHQTQQSQYEETPEEETAEMEDEFPLLKTEEEFIAAVKHWVVMDNHIQALNVRVKEARDMVNLLTLQIHQFVEDNNMDHPSIEISDGELILCEKREYQSLSFSYIERCLTKLVKDPAHVAKIVDYLRDNRGSTVVPIIRRTRGAKSS
jgi:hypothetical protein